MTDDNTVNTYRSVVITQDALAVEHEIQRQMLKRLGIEWTPGEPFYSLVEAEITRLRDAGLKLAAETATESALKDAEIQRLLVDNAELSTECDQWGEKLAEAWAELDELRRSQP